MLFIAAHMLFIAADLLYLLACFGLLTCFTSLVEQCIANVMAADMLYLLLTLCFLLLTCFTSLVDTNRGSQILGMAESGYSGCETHIS
jgi:hypothetical protein